MHWKEFVFMDKNMKYLYGAVAFGVVLFCTLTNLGTVMAGVSYVLGVFRPVTIGVVLAFVLNVPMMKIETWLKKKSAKRKKPLSDGFVRNVSLGATLVVILVIFGLLIGTVVPQFTTSFGTAMIQLQKRIPQIQELIRAAGYDGTWTTELLNRIDTLMNNSGQITGTISSAVTGAVSTISLFAGSAVQILIAMIIMVYILLDKERLLRQCGDMAAAFLPEKWNEKGSALLATWCDVYDNFFVGQCTEAFILAVLMIVAFQVFRLPFGGLVGVLSGVLSFIPYVGSFLACGIGVLLTLLLDPWKALLMFLVYQVVQFVENQFIYPKVVGKSVGLPPIWIVISVLVGGNLFGVLGMLFAIPVMATVYVLLRGVVARRTGKTAGKQTEK